MLSRPPFAVLLFFSILIVVGTALGQGRVAPITQPGPAMGGNMANPYASITVIVADDSGMNLDEQAVVKLSSTMNATNLWAATQDRSQVVFDGIPPADYQIEVNAAGYDSANKDINVMSSNENYDVIVRLRRDASSGAEPPPPGQAIEGGARKEAQKAIAALTAGDLKSAQKHLEKAYKTASGNADVNYLMGLLYTRKNDNKQAESYLLKAIVIDNKHVRALTMLGELRLRREDYKGAIDPLQRAVAANGDFWVAHWLLSEAYLRDGDFNKSRQQAELAIEKGKGGAVEAQLVLGEALANLGQREEAIQAFQTYLEKSPKSSAAESVRKVIAQLQNAETASYKPASTPLMAPAAAAISSPSVPEAGLSIPTWHPPSVDDEKLTFATGATCPVKQVIGGAGKSAEELVDNVGRFEATEDVMDQELDAAGRARTTIQRRFDYMASIATDSDTLVVNESQVSLSDKGDFPNHITTHGIAALALVFHPLMRSDYDMTCEGLSQWKGRATWLVYFRQRPDKPDRFLRYSFSDGDYWVALKGRAWIAADTFQIVHLEADLLNPMPKIWLLRQHQSVDYGPVEFKTKKTRLWLPKNAEIYFDFRRHLYYRRHGFENYKLFAVGASEKISQPKVPDNSEKCPERNH
jgi:tetratricopeptide (TPR) repeat protein